jgi:hypothetical protein
LRCASPAEQLQQAVLGVVRVLVLVDEHVPEARAVARADLGKSSRTLTVRPSRSSKSIAFERMQALLVELVDVRDGLLEVRADELPVGRRVAQLVLRVGDLVVQRGRA